MLLSESNTHHVSFGFYLPFDDTCKSIKTSNKCYCLIYFSSKKTFLPSSPDFVFVSKTDFSFSLLARTSFDEQRNYIGRIRSLSLEKHSSLSLSPSRSFVLLFICFCFVYYSLSLSTFRNFVYLCILPFLYLLSLFSLLFLVCLFLHFSLPLSVRLYICSVAYSSF